MKIIDNLLPQSYQNELEETFLNDHFPWYYNSQTDYNLFDTAVQFDDYTVDSLQFVHQFFLYGQVTSKFFEKVYPIVFFLEKETGVDYRRRLIRIKANMLCIDKSLQSGMYNAPHVDHETDEVESLLYYVNDSDGDTVIFNERKGITPLTVNSTSAPVKGKSILFNSSFMHSSTPPRQHKTRVVLNFVFAK